MNVKLFQGFTAVLSVVFILFSLLTAYEVSAAGMDEKIYKFQKKLASNGNKEAQFKLGYMYEIGRGVKQSFPNAKKWYKESLKNGFLAANHRLSYLEIKQNGFKAKDRNWLKKLKTDTTTDHHAMFLLGSMYEAGIGVKSNISKAEFYYKRSTAKGNADAEERLFQLEQKKRMIHAQKTKRDAERKARLKAEKRAAEKIEKEKKRKQALARKKAEDKRAQEKMRLAKIKRDENSKIKQRKIEAAKKKKTEEKVRMAQLKREQEKNKPKIAVNDAEPEFETELCTGKAARFRTQCN